MTAIEQIKAKQAEAKLKARADLLLLADVLAQGEQPPPDALAILTTAGATADQLEKLVTIAKERLELEPRAAALLAIQADRGKVQKELEAADAECLAELEKLQAKHVAKLGPMRAKVAALSEAEADSRYAKQRLQTLANDLAKAGVESGPVTSAVMDRGRSAPRVTEEE